MAEPETSPAAMGRTGFDLMRILETQGRQCAICSFVNAGIKRHIDGLFYERVNDPPTRAAIRAAGGFCRHHARLVAKQADALGTGIIFEDVLQNQLCRLEAGAFDHPPHGSGTLSRLLDQVGKRPSTRPQCPLCEAEAGFEVLAADRLLEGMSHPEFVDLYRQSAGLCLPHFTIAYDRGGDEEAWRVVLEVEKAAIAGLTRELAELIRKYDYRFRDEPHGAEAGSWRRALNMTSGWPDA